MGRAACRSSDFTTLMCGFWRRGVVSVSVAFTALAMTRTGGLLDTLTVLPTLAASASAKVTTCREVVVQVMEAFGARVVPGQPTPNANEASVTPTGFRVTLPSLVTTNL